MMKILLKLREFPDQVYIDEIYNAKFTGVLHVDILFLFLGKSILSSKRLDWW